MATTETPAKANPGSEQKPAATTPAGTEQKPVEQKPAETTPKPGAESAEKPASKDDTAKPESKAPAKYTLTLPDGGRIDAHDLATIETLARAQGWSNEDAQARVNEHAAAIEAQTAQFLVDTTADTVYGGAQLDATLKHATAALDHFRPKGTPRGDAFRALLDKSGYGNHLEVVSLLADLGRLMAEDGTAGGSGGSGETRDAATLIYGADKAAVS
jgi:hypothetical protein